jgi:hypothetical protein
MQLHLRAYIVSVIQCGPTASRGRNGLFDPYLLAQSAENSFATVAGVPARECTRTSCRSCRRRGWGASRLQLRVPFAHGVHVDTRAGRGRAPFDDPR